MADVVEHPKHAVKRPFAPLVWARLIRVTHKMRRAVNCDMRPTGFTIAQLRIFFEVQAQPGMTQQELADKLQLTKGNIAQLVEKMEGDGLLARTQQGRLKHLSLTPKGEAVMREHLQHHDQFITHQLAALSEEELHQLRHLLRKLDRSLA